MREGMASTGGAAPSSDASPTDGFKLGLASFAACLAGARPRFATRVCKRLLSRPRSWRGSRGRDLNPEIVTCGLAERAYAKLLNGSTFPISESAFPHTD